MQPPYVAMILASACLASFVMASPALADDRYFPFTYQYATPGQGEREIEFFTDASAADGVTNQLEFEYGITDHFAMSLYAVANPYPFAFRGINIEARYRLFERNVLPVDVTLYAEVENVFAAPNIEAKLILQKDFGPVSLQANLVAEKAFDAEPLSVHGSAGCAISPSELLHPGVEINYDHGALSAGPTFALTYGTSKAVVGIYGGTAGLLGRLILQQEF